MRIGLTGGGTGGHFFPLIAVAQNLRDKHPETDLFLYYFGPEKFDQKKLDEQNIRYVHIPSGKRRLYSSIQNYLDIFKIGFGIFVALMKLPIYYPDVIFSKGGYTAYPVLFAARILQIPIVIHDSDTVPGRVSVYSAKFAKLVAVAWSECAKFFVEKRKINEAKIMSTGLPVRKELNPMYKMFEHQNKFLFLKKSFPLITVLGGSQGSQNLNQEVIATLPFVLPFAQVIHQTGKANFSYVKKITDKLLENVKDKDNYFVQDFFDDLSMREIYENSSLIIMRGGSQILETFLWGIPTIVVPITSSNGDHQRENAYASMRRGASIVIEEKNLTPHLLQNEILRLLQDNQTLTRMSASARESAIFDASEKIGDVLLKICRNH